MPRQKGTPKTGGRKAGTPNKTPSEVKKLCQEHGIEIISVLLTVARNPVNPAAQVSACRELLDRGFGKSPTTVEGTEDGPPVKQQIVVCTGVREIEFGGGKLRWPTPRHWLRFYGATG
jgi:hypothetical protein